MFKVLTFCIFCVFVIAGTSQAQSTCSIKTSTEVFNAHQGKRDGQIKIVIDNDKNDGRFKVFLLNQGVEQAKKQIASRQVNNLTKGLYEFIIIDTQREKCFKEISVQITEAN